MKKIVLVLLLSVVYSINAQIPITATIPFQGYDEGQAYLGQAEYQIYMDVTNGVLDKPIILVDGFDPTDTRNLEQMYNLLGYDGQNLADVLRNEGFDFVLLNFPVYNRTSDNVLVDGGVDYIQRNAMVLVELINQINAQKVGNEELVVIGPSMGGLVSRYALRFMEQDSQDHQTRLFVSWDAPHMGANIPIGFQYLFNYIGVQTGDQQIQDAVTSSLNSPASKEMLVDHYLGHLLAGSDFEQDPNILEQIGAPNFRDAFQSELDEMGFPQQVRNITVANGSGLGEMIGSPGINVIDNTFDIPNAPNTTTEVVVNFTPFANQTSEVTNVGVFIQILPAPLPPTQVASFTADSQSPASSDGLDSAPGGMYDLASFTGGTQGNPLLEDFINSLNQSAFDFIPTLSSLAVTNESDWYENPDLNGLHNSPFVAWYIPNTNEDHVTLTQQNVDFVLPEIRNQVIGINDNIFANKYKLKTNPVSNNINIQLDNSYNYNHVSVNIVSVTGQKLLQNDYNSVSNEINIPVNLNTGVYFLTISDSETSLSNKFIVK